ncbi:MAG: NUDIX domain-containing protein [Pseudomonadota bacterium]
MPKTPSNTPVFQLTSQELLADDWSTLTKYTFQFKRRDGTWQEQVRQAYDRGHGAACLLHNVADDTVLLTRQFRLPALIGDEARGHNGFLIEAPAGLLEGADPAMRMKAELEEETGYSVRDITLVFDAFMSPGAVTERIACFTGTYTANDKTGDGGGQEEEGEDIEVLHVRFDHAMEMISSGEIIDAKTIMLLQHLALQRAG